MLALPPKTFSAGMAKKFPIHPKHPERICWGCDKYCAVDQMYCGNGSERTPHPVESVGEDWFECLQAAESGEKTG